MPVPASERMFSEILVPTDFSEHATQALRLAIKLAKVNGARITLLHVGLVPGLGMYDHDVYGMTPTNAIVALHEEMAREQKHVLDRIAREEIPADVPWRAVALEGFAPEEIVRFCKAEKCDLIVMSTHGRSGIARAFLGSIAERVLRIAEVPVLFSK